MKFNSQLFGRDCPPFYGKADIFDIIAKISKVDEKINELAIEREQYVKDLEEKVKEVRNTKA